MLLQPDVGVNAEEEYPIDRAGNREVNRTAELIGEPSAVFVGKEKTGKNRPVLDHLPLRGQRPADIGKRERGEYPRNYGDTICRQSKLCNRPDEQRYVNRQRDDARAPWVATKYL